MEKSATDFLICFGNEKGESSHHKDGSHRNYKQEIENLSKSATDSGIVSITYDGNWLSHNTSYLLHKDIFDRNCYSWAFKQAIVNNAILISEYNDVVIYSDSNSIVKEYPARIVEIARANGLYIHYHSGQNEKSHYKNYEYTNQDTFISMGLAYEDIMLSPHIHANVFAFCKNEKGLNLLEEYTYWCLCYDAMVGRNTYSNPISFKGHRYDQSILSIIVAKNKVPISLHCDGVIDEVDPIIF